LNQGIAHSSDRRLSPAAGAVMLGALIVGGLFYVKWLPYYHRAFTAFSNHSIGKSILMGGAAKAPPPSLQAAFDYAITYGKAIWQAMMLGLLVGSALQEFTPRAWISRLLGRPGLRSVATGGLLALPGMMCTCCAAPVVIGLRRQGASAAAAVAFWLGNTVLNPATLVFMGFVLGWKWAGLRLALGVALVIGCGCLVDRFAASDETDMLSARLAGNAETLASTASSIKGWLMRFARLALGLIPEYLILVLILGATRAWLFPQIGPAIGNEFYWILIMAAAGLLSVIPTAGEVPIVQAMLALGIGVGPAAALMMTLAPVSLPSLAMTAKTFRSRTLGLVALLVLSAGVAAGLLAVALNF
jgi:uncharacterized membrane protein YraQ (UPF0718 family)